MAERKVVLVRIQPALYDALRRWAADDFRSVNGQIEFLLHQAAHRAGRLGRGSGAEGAPGTPTARGGPASAGRDAEPSGDAEPPVDAEPG